MFRRSLATISVTGTVLCGTPAFAAEPISRAEAIELRDEIARLKAQIARMESRLGPAPDGAPATIAAAPPPAKPAPATDIGWKGSPQFTSDDRAFKVKGRIQTDIGYIAAPRGTGDRGFGYSSEFRRVRLGGEGKLGSGIGYKLELEFSDNAVDLVDAFVTYERRNWLFTIGNHNQFQSLDELTGDTSGSFMERAAFTDAFNFERRLGISAQYKLGDALLQAGIFGDDIAALANASDGPAGGDENNSFSTDARFVYAPKIGSTQLHIGASAHLRQLNRIEEAGVRYRQRPYLHSSNSRILATPVLNVDRELDYGIEAAAIRGPWHIAGEGHWLNAIRPDAPDARFFGGYAEIGYFLTRGDSRSYKNGVFGTADPKSPLGKGGIGAVQINLRYDYLDLNGGGILGGTQNAYLASVVWTPINYLRFNLNYGYLNYDDAAILANGRGDYGIHVLGGRMELDF